MKNVFFKHQWVQYFRKASKKWKNPKIHVQCLRRAFEERKTQRFMFGVLKELLKNGKLQRFTIGWTFKFQRMENQDSIGWASDLWEKGTKIHKYESWFSCFRASGGLPTFGKKKPRFALGGFLTFGKKKQRFINTNLGLGGLLKNGGIKICLGGFPKNENSKIRSGLGGLLKNENPKIHKYNSGGLLRIGKRKTKVRLASED
ncbi:hypothetical protein RhiirB3_450480 [Rhizophagus irregularis]|nr:hypothetical protein RhiirB3_450480 [Rhizophagus irregularis]